MSILVSVPVLTYNAAEFVEETLESIFNQTYSNIELIISDDCSKDNTVEIVTKWCEQDRVKARFTNIKIITVPKNTGIPANYNRCVNASSGEWIKMISGDDGLMPNCVEDNINHVTANPEIKVLYSYLKIYRNTFEEKNFIRLSPASYPTHIITDEITAFEQYQLFLVSDRIQFTPSMFLNKKAILEAGLPKEHLFSEDFQTKLNLTKAGFKLHFFEKQTVLYRQHEMATNNMIQDYVLKPHYFNTLLSEGYQKLFLSDSADSESGFFRHCRQLDSKMNRFYLARPEEMAARAFEKVLQMQPLKNSFLVSGTLKSDAAAHGIYPDDTLTNTLADIWLRYFSLLGHGLTNKNNSLR